MPVLNKVDSITNTRLALYLIVIGLLLAVDSFFELSIVYKLWPLLILILGIGLIIIFFKRRARESMYLAAGEYLVFFSGMALYCNFTSWQNLSHLWPLFITPIGIIFISFFFFSRKNRMLFFLGLLFILLTVFFLLIFSVSSQFWWLIFIIIGISILITGQIK